jgi:hypothetical protein
MTCMPVLHSLRSARYRPITVFAIPQLFVIIFEIKIVWTSLASLWSRSINVFVVPPGSAEPKGFQPLWIWMRFFYLPANLPGAFF